MLRTTRAFSLIELLTVIAIAAILGAISIVVLNRSGGSMPVGPAAQILSSELELARQTAMTQNVPVEFRIYRLTGETYAYQSWTINPDGGTPSPISPVRRLPQGLVFAKDPAYSTLLTETLDGDAPATLPDGPAPYKYFRFTPSGRMDLDDSKTWTLTLWNARDVISKPPPPANYATLHIDPMIGRVRVTQP